MNTLVQGPVKATLFKTENEALMAGEEFCHSNPETHGQDLVEVAKKEGGWVAVVLPEGQDFDTFLQLASMPAAANDNRRISRHRWLMFLCRLAVK